LNTVAERSVKSLEQQLNPAARLLKLLANEQRLMILCRLVEGECSVGDLSDHIGLAQSATSQHLARLRLEGIVDTRRNAQTIYYSLNDPAAIRLLTTLGEIYG
jgi:ArsR family transcriptional regulator, virulence genes transcriptional regulator